jgi:hypothetical protein
LSSGWAPVPVIRSQTRKLNCHLHWHGPEAGPRHPRRGVELNLRRHYLSLRLSSLAAALPVRPSAAAPLTTRPPAAPAGASGASATFLNMRVCRRSAAGHAPLCYSARSQRRVGLRPYRRLRRLSARPSAALRCCRIRLHWPATAPLSRALYHPMDAGFTK